MQFKTTMNGPGWALKPLQTPTEAEEWGIEPEIKPEKNKESNHKRIRCVHGRRNDRCGNDDCSKEYKCIHKCRKGRCTLCGGPSVCLLHKRRKDNCKPCKTIEAAKAKEKTSITLDIHCNTNEPEHVSQDEISVEVSRTTPDSTIKPEHKRLDEISMEVLTREEILVIPEVKSKNGWEASHRRIRCVHGLRIDRCHSNDCSKKYKCMHNRRKGRCGLCGGGSYCLLHGKRKDTCKICSGKYTCVNNDCSHVTLKAGTQCKTCLTVGSSKLKFHIKVSEKRLQWHLKTWAVQNLIPIYLSYDKRLEGINTMFCNAVRPDFVWDLGSWVLVCENDEQAHAYREPRCDLIRNQDIMNAFGEVPVYVIRFNPHAFKVYDATKTIGTVERMELLLKLLQGIFANPTFEHILTVHYMFYSCTRCISSKKCSLQHIDQFKTMVDYANYIEEAYPLRLFGTNQLPGPSPLALH